MFLILILAIISIHAIQSLIKLGAISFLPKEEMFELKEFLEDVVLKSEKSIWIRSFDRFGNYFNSLFGPKWKEKDKFFQEFEESLRRSEEEGFL